MSLLAHTPSFSDDQAKSLATDLFGIDVSEISPLPSERDQNFHIVDFEGQAFVLKVSNATEERELLVAQNTMMKLASSGMESDSSKPAPRAIASQNGNDIEIAIGNNDTNHLARLVSYAHGTPLGKLKYHSAELMQKLGTTIGQLTQSLENFENESLNRTFHWDLAQAVNVVQEREHLVEDEKLRGIINQILARFQATTVPALEKCPQSYLHNDANDGNVVVSDKGKISLIDYGDAVYGWTIGDLAIAIAYAILEKPDPLKTANEILAGYVQVRPISPPELTALFGLISIRLCVSAVMAAEQQTARPDDPYLSISQKPIRVTLPLLAAIPFEFAESTFRATAGLDPNPHSKRITDWLSLSDQKFAFPLHGISRDSTKFHVLDLSVSSQLLFGDQETLPQSELAVAIDSAIDDNQSDIGVGRYLEPRLIYNSEMFAAHTLEAENRTIHLGMDLFVDAGSKICAPIQGTVEVVSNNTQPLDYGGLVVLRHETTSGDSFFSLYGHLSPTSIEQLEIGQTIESGEVLASLGDPSENGGWPPHLHFQLITDMLSMGSDYVGVCTATWKTRWSDFCPDPNLILNIPADCFPAEKPDHDSHFIVETRADIIKLKPLVSQATEDRSWLEKLSL